MFLLDTLNPLLGYFKPIEFIKKFMLFEGEGGGDTSWRDTLPDPIKADPIFQKYESANDAHVALVEAQKFIGREHLPVPSGPEDTAAFAMLHKAIGRPETVEGYKTPDDIKFEEGFPSIDEGMVKTMKQIAHDSGMSTNQFDKFYRGYMDYANTQFKGAVAKVNTDREAQVAGLRKELGAAYPATEALAQKVVTKFADENAWNTLDGGLGNNPAMVKMLANIGKVLSEHNLVGDAPTSSESPEEAQTELRKMAADLKGPLFDAQHPQHQEYLDKRERLTNITLGK